MYSMLVIFMAKTNSPRRGLFLDMAILFLKGRLLGAHTLASFLHAAILSRVSEWSGSGTNTRLRTRLTAPEPTRGYFGFKTPYKKFK